MKVRRIEGKNMFEYNTKCRVNATYRRTTINIYDRTGVYTNIIITYSKQNVQTAPNSKRLNDLTASTGERGPCECCKCYVRI